MRRGIRKREQKRILLTGTQEGTGATHLSLAIANAAFSKERRKTLYMEIGSGGGIADLPKGKTFEEGGVAGFICLGVYYLPGTEECAARKILCDPSWDVIVCDVTEWEKAAAFFTLCTDCLILCNLRPWHYTVFRQRMKELLCGMNEKRVSYYSFGLQRPDEKRAREEFGIRVEAVPEIANPFRMTREEVKRVAAFLQPP